MHSHAHPLLEIERVRFEPLLPSKLKEISSLVVESFEKLPLSSDVVPFFPCLKEESARLELKQAAEKKRYPLRVGVVFSGGQAPGGHNVVAGIWDAITSFHLESSFVGFLDGPSGIIENRYKELKLEEILRFRNLGGFHLLGSGRTKIETSSQLEASLQTALALNLDGLVIIGGDDSNTNAAHLAEYFLKNGSKTSVVGVPKTIDGDLKNEWVETSFGFDTACKVYAELIGNIARDALSAKKYYHFIKLMGRSASHVTLECALQTHPNLALIGEEIKDKHLGLKDLINKIVDLIVERAMHGKHYGVILIPEGIIEFVDEIQSLIKELNRCEISSLPHELKKTWELLPKFLQEQLLMEKDSHGNVRVSQIQTEEFFLSAVRSELKKNDKYKGTFQPISHFFGYEGRSAFPSNFDANYCYTLGYVAATLIKEKKTGYMAIARHLSKSVENWEGGGIPLTSLMHLEERKGKKIPVVQKKLVSLEEAPFKAFSSCRESWRLEDLYQCPGPIQFEGSSHLVNQITHTLKIEHEKSHVLNRF